MEFFQQYAHGYGHLTAANLHKDTRRERDIEARLNAVHDPYSIPLMVGLQHYVTGRAGANGDRHSESQHVALPHPVVVLLKSAYDDLRYYQERCKRLEAMISAQEEWQRDDVFDV